MPTENEKQAQAKQALEWLNKHWSQSKACPICGQAQWQLSPACMIVEDLGPNHTFDYSNQLSYIPVNPVVCMNCGYTFLINSAIGERAAKDGSKETTPDGQ
ncbi:hypothetical protein KIH79_09210 [Bifidobacterium sp. 82T10]|uniref:Uncharacterized protein n=1 Tax=Bifidobacterium miconis TaxID=2834435 RepID=A0ABS6WHP0_9BIFI|nr:hypothetical protein [Bifidobacterium miconis]MBW3093094.1 hypothetical protein [Bifidobacterium miconis]